MAFGGGLQFLRALKECLLDNSVFNITESPNLDNQIILINGWNKGPSAHLIEDEIINLKKYGYTSLLDILFKNKICDSSISRVTDRFKFHNVFIPLLQLLSKSRRPRIVHRVDGFRSHIYQDGSKDVKLFSKYPTDKIQMNCMNIADFVIFQSNFSLNIAKKLGYNKNNFKVIHNGVNQNLFFPDEDFTWDGLGKLKIVSSSWSDNLHKGFAEIAGFSENKNVEVTFIGNWNKEIDSKNVIILPPMKQDSLSEYYRKNHVLLFPSINESCPNTVLEALSSGLPVFYKNSGGTPEICESFGVTLEGSCVESLENMKLNYKDLRNNVLNANSTFSIEKVGFIYEKLLQNCAML